MFIASRKNLFYIYSTKKRWKIENGSSSNILYVYHTQDPDGDIVVEASVRDYGLWIGQKDYVVIDGLDLKYTNLDALYFEGDDSTIQNCTLQYAYRYGLNINNRSDTDLIQHNTISNNAQQGIYIGGEDNTLTHTLTIT